MIRFPYILNVKYPYGTQHYYSITLSWCCVHVEIRVDVWSDITSHYLSHITLSNIEIMVDVGNDNYVGDVTRNYHYLSDITLIIIEIMVDVRNDNYVSDITRNHHYDSDITLSIVKIMIDVGNDN